MNWATPGGPSSRDGGAARAVRREVAALDRDLPLGQVATLDEGLARSISLPRFRALLLASFAGLALLLAALGIYGVIAQTVARRTNEIGVRIALGASPGCVLKGVIGQGVRLTAVGVLAGLAGALALTRVVESLLFETSPTDPAVLAAAAAVLVGAALVASWLPARRAARVDPLVALRNE